MVTASGGRPVPSADASSATAETMASLRAEIDGLRASAQLRAVIEQAKGILVEREGINLNEAFAKLRKMSQEHNVRLVEVAATIVGVAVPRLEEGTVLNSGVLREQLPASAAPSTTWRALQEQQDVREGLLSALLDSVAGSTSEGDRAAQLLFELLSPFEVDGLTLYRTTLDGSLRAIGNVGVEADVASAWRNIPLSFDIPLSRAVLERRALFWPNRSVRTTEFPAVRGVVTKFGATAVIPVFDDGEVTGIVGLMWESDREFDDETRAAITRSVDRVGPLVMRHTAESDPDLDWLQSLMSLHLDPWLLLDTITSADNEVRQLIVQDVSQLLPDGTDWLGRRFLEIWPEAANDGTWDSLISLVRTGGRWTMTVGAACALPWGTPGTRLRAVRVGRRVAMVWRPPAG